MRRFGEGESRYLKGSDLMKPGGGYSIANVTIQSVTVELVGEEKDEKYILYFAGKDKGMALNKTNENVLIDLFGMPDDSTPEALSAQFSNHKIQLYFDPGVTFAGKRVGGLRLREVQAAIPAPASRRAPAPPPPPVDDVPYDDESPPF